jgi:hypothetical protein
VDSPDFFRAELYGDDPPSLKSRIGLELIVRFDRKVRWAMSHGAWVMGKSSPWEVMKAYRDYMLRDVSAEITCDVLLLAGSRDHFVSGDLVEKNANALVHARSLKTIVYDEDTGGQEHCQVGAATLWWADVFQWLEETYR